jgi:hypothetical protein
MADSADISNFGTKHFQHLSWQTNTAVHGITPKIQGEPRSQLPAAAAMFAGEWGFAALRCEPGLRLRCPVGAKHFRAFGMNNHELALCTKTGMWYFYSVFYSGDCT